MIKRYEALWSFMQWQSNKEYPGLECFCRTGKEPSRLASMKMNFSWFMDGRLQRRRTTFARGRGRRC